MTWTRSATGSAALTILVLLLLTALTVPASATGGTHDNRARTGHARFEGRDIDLKRGWGDAHTCVVWNADGETDCFRTEQAADAAVARRERTEVRTASAAPAWSLATLVDATLDDLPLATLASTCVDWLYLYENTNFGGRSLRFRDRGYYQDLADWGFANQTSSYAVGSCSAVLRDGDFVLYPGNTGAFASATSMVSGWNDRIRYLKIN